jgi:hypothetical protein
VNHFVTLEKNESDLFDQVALLNLFIDGTVAAWFYFWNELLENKEALEVSLHRIPDRFVLISKLNNANFPIILDKHKLAGKKVIFRFLKLNLCHARTFAYNFVISSLLTQVYLSIVFASNDLPFDSVKKYESFRLWFYSFHVQKCQLLDRVREDFEFWLVFQLNVQYKKIAKRLSEQNIVSFRDANF